MLGINREQLKYLSAAAKAIVMQSAEMFDEARKFLPDSLLNLSLYHYIAGFYVGKIVDTYEKFIYNSLNKADLDLTNYVSFKAKQVIIEIFLYLYRMILNLEVALKLLYVIANFMIVNIILIL